MRRFMLPILIVFGLPWPCEGAVQSRGENILQNVGDLQFEVPADSRIVERTIFSDSGLYNASKIRIIQILPSSLRKGELTQSAALARLEIFEPAPTLGPDLWAAGAIGDKPNVVTHPSRVGDEDALALDFMDAAGRIEAREVYLVSEGRGILISSRNIGILDSILTTLRFVKEDQQPQEIAPNLGEIVEESARAAIPRVRLVYLVPSDRNPNERYRSQMERAIRELQDFYRRQLGGKTFSLNTPVVEVVRTNHPVSWYTLDAPASSSAGRFWESVTQDGLDLLHGSFDDPENRWIFYIDADPLCGQYVGGTSGVALLPANDLRGLACEDNIPSCSGGADLGKLCRWVGGLGHLVGLSFNLPHPEAGTCPDGDRNCDHALMLFGYTTFPDAYLLPSDKSSLLTSPATRNFFRALPRTTFKSCRRGCPGPP